MNSFSKSVILPSILREHSYPVDTEADYAAISKQDVSLIQVAYGRMRQADERQSNRTSAAH